MADITQKQLSIAADMVALAGQFDDMYNSIEQALAEKAQVPDYTDELLASNGATQHITAADLTTLSSRYTEMLAWIDAAGEYRRDILRKARA